MREIKCASVRSCVLESYFWKHKFWYNLKGRGWTFWTVVKLNLVLANFQGITQRTFKWHMKCHREDEQTPFLTTYLHFCSQHFTPFPSFVGGASFGISCTVLHYPFTGYSICRLIKMRRLNTLMQIFDAIVHCKSELFSIKVYNLRNPELSDSALLFQSFWVGSHVIHH